MEDQLTDQSKFVSVIGSHTPDAKETKLATTKPAKVVSFGLANSKENNECRGLFTLRYYVY